MEKQVHNFGIYNNKIATFINTVNTIIGILQRVFADMMERLTSFAIQ